MSGKTTREHIIEAADRLFYERGFEASSFADIAEAVGISRGNFYHHFKSKDEILDAVIELRLAATRKMLERWEQQAGVFPADRIRKFIQMLVENRKPIMRYGCPVGTLCAELSKLEHGSKAEAGKLFGLFRTWLGEQFASLGLAQEADVLAMHLLVRSQGIAALANAFHDEAFLQREVESMNAWLSEEISALIAPTTSRSRPEDRRPDLAGPGPERSLGGSEKRRRR